jgi:hypothetical protein
MANGIKALRQIQMSREASASQGSPTTDFTVWRGTGTLEDLRETTFPEEDIGKFGGVDRTYSPKTGGQLVLDETPATFEQLPHIFDAGIANATPTTDTSSAFIRTYNFPIESTDVKESTDLQTYSFKAGDNNEVEKCGFGHVSEFTLSGAAAEALMITATFDTREVSTDGDGFATVTIPDVEEILFSKGKLFIDAVGGVLGATQVTKTLLAAELKVTTGWKGIDTGDGRVDFSFIKQTQPEITLDVTFEHNGSASAEKSAWRAGTARKLQLLFEGSALATTDAGATYDVKSLVVNLAGKWEKFEKLDEMDGNDIVKATFRSRYNSTAALFAQFIIANEVETMP